ncbi:MAG TPA: dipeptide epimerase, partial [Fimbriimonadaceae bacterium]|nr:dipeptide epimerase [Fimbriimonadaceae bacterium]
MEATFRRIELKKLYPLAISRGTMASSENLFVTLTEGAHSGTGELSPATGSAWTAERGEEQLRSFIGQAGLDDPAPHVVYAKMRELEIDPPAMAALDVALWDLLAKKAGLPLYQMLGLPRQSVPTSITIGINPPEVTRERVPDILQRSGAKCLKIKLGSPEGRDHDKAHFEAAREAAAPYGPKLRVDANGGWSVDEAKMMMSWLAERGVDYVEQPLVEGAESDLPAIFENRPLPIFVDESCRYSRDVPKFAHFVDGVNLKLMKCGGITEAVRIVATARAFGLKTMIGCMSESSIAIGGGAAIGALFDYIDLDSHLNLDPDCASGLGLEEGVVVPPVAPGHGAS